MLSARAWVCNLISALTLLTLPNLLVVESEIEIHVPIGTTRLHVSSSREYTCNSVCLPACVEHGFITRRWLLDRKLVLRRYSQNFVRNHINFAMQMGIVLFAQACMVASK
jgi:hypothetical protein